MNCYIVLTQIVHEGPTPLAVFVRKQDAELLEGILNDYIKSGVKATLPFGLLWEYIPYFDSASVVVSRFLG